jgi:hypothetical protein
LLGELFLRLGKANAGFSTPGMALDDRDYMRERAAQRYAAWLEEDSFGDEPPRPEYGSPLRVPTRILVVAVVLGLALTAGLGWAGFKKMGGTAALQALAPLVSPAPPWLDRPRQATPVAPAHAPQPSAEPAQAN